MKCDVVSLVKKEWSLLLFSTMEQNIVPPFFLVISAEMIVFILVAC